MKKNYYLDLFEKVYLKYCTQMIIRMGEDGEGFYCYPFNKEIVIENRVFMNPDDWDVFALLHEIGHVFTTTKIMKRCEQEYYATKWAIGEARKLNFNVPQEYIDVYQNYIWEYREKGIKHGAKNIPSKEELTLCA